MFYIFDRRALVRPVEGIDIPKAPEEQELRPDVGERLAEVMSNDQNTIFAVVSDEGAVARGEYGMGEANALMTATVQAINGTLGVYDPHDPDGTVEPFNVDSYSRMPNPGLLEYLIEQVGAIESETVFVGLDGVGLQAALAAGIEFAHSDEFFGRNGG